jgi:hypothetical protein
MGRKAKKRKLWKQAQENGNQVIVFVAKDWYDERWPQTTFTVNSGGIFETKTRNGPLSVMGWDFTISPPDRDPLNGMYGVAVVREGDDPSLSGQTTISAHLPTRTADLQPYHELIVSMLRDMIRNEAVPSFEEITENAIAKGVMHPPEYQEVA